MKKLKKILANPGLTLRAIYPILRAMKKYEALKNKFGSHSAAAREMGITPRHYRYIRSTGKLPKPLGHLIDLLLRDSSTSREAS